MGDLYKSIIDKNHILAAYHRIHEKFFDPYLQLYKPFVSGIDGVDLLEFSKKINERIDDCRRFLVDRKLDFAPQILRRVPKDTPGEFREVYLNTLRDKVVQKAIASVLTDAFEKHYFPNLYSYRRGKSYGQMAAARKVSRLLREEHHRLHLFKTDVPDFTDNIDQSIMTAKFEALLENEPEIMELLRKYIQQKRCANGVLSTPRKGIPTGSSLTTVCANLYLTELDELMFRRGETYFRFGDDILLIARSKAASEEGEKLIREVLEKNKLALSEEKTLRCLPREPLEYLGYGFNGGTIDVAAKSLKKYRKWIREILPREKYRGEAPRSSQERKHMVKRTVIELNTATERGLAQLPWVRSFPIMNTDASLRAMDAFIKDRIRLCVLGKVSRKARALIPEAWFRELGYKSLTGAYYRISRRRPFGPYQGWRLYFGMNYEEAQREENGFFGKQLKRVTDKIKYLKDAFGGHYLPQM